MEEGILLWIHGYASPFLDQVFLFSNIFGLLPICTILVTAMALVHLFRGERRDALAWVVAGLATFASTELIKYAVARPRPVLWETLVHPSGFSFPSGHALASATFYPLLAWGLLRRRRVATGVAYAIGALFALFVGFGRLYLGVHWPSDVLAGWLLGFVQSALVVAWLKSMARPSFAESV
ncbi:MAG: phosphatase PAP2 family protein [Acidobacteriota bacterium]